MAKATDLIQQDRAARQAALDVQQSFLVQAPAGSGKTELLTQRYLALLPTVTNPESIIAITFTKKAAGEMRARIAAALLAAQKQTPVSQPHEKATRELAQAALKHSGQQQWHLITQPQRMKIITIDALAGMLAKAMPIRSQGCGLNQITTQPSFFYQRAIDQLFEQLNQDTQHGQALARLLQHCDNQWQNLAQLLMQLLQQREQWLPYLVIGDNDYAALRHYLNQTIASLVEQYQRNLLKQCGEHNIQELWSLLSFALTNLDDINAEHPWYSISAHENIDIGLAQQPKWRAMADLLLTKDDLWRKRLDKNLGFPPAAKSKAQKQKLVQLISEFATQPNMLDSWKLLRKMPSNTHSDEQWQVIKDLTRILPLLTALLQRLFQQAQSTDFSQINLAADLALGDMEQPTDLAFYLEYHIQHILIDEFQDTSRLHFGILEKILAQWQTGDGHSIFLVGDPQQSIYRFRQADVALFLQVKNSGMADIRPTYLQLCQNFRSDTALVNWFNDSFAKIFGSTEDANQGRVGFQRAAATKDISDVSGVYCYPLQEDQCTYADLIPSLINSLRQKPPNASIAILVRSRKHLSPTLSILRQHDIAYHTVEIERLSDCVEIIDLCNLSLALHYPGDRALWLACLRAPWCGLSLAALHQIAHLAQNESIIYALLQRDQLRLEAEDQKRLNHCAPILLYALNNRGRTDIVSWVKGTYMALDGPSCLSAAYEHDNVALFFEALNALVAEQIPLTQHTLEQQLQQIYAATAPASAGSIAIMTIHKAKGLQFDHVILSHCDRKSRSEGSALLRWMELGIAGQKQLLLAPMHAKYGEDDPIYRCLQALEKLQLHNEMKRLFYVACTRAKSGLHLLYELKKNKDKQKDKKFAPPPDSSLLSLLPDIPQQMTFAMKQRKANNESKDKTLVIQLQRLQQMNSKNPFLAYIKTMGHQYTPLNYREQNNAAAFGIVLHQVLHDIAEIGIEKITPKYLMTQQQRWQYYLQQHMGQHPKGIMQQLVRLQQAVEHCLSDPRAQWILSGLHQSAQCEYALHYKGKAQLKTAIIDRCFIDQDEYWIIDYKSAVPKEEQGEAAFFQQQQYAHQAQLQLYAQLCTKITNQPVRAALYFPLCCKWLEIAHT